MRIYKKIVIDMETLKTINTESYEYEGEVAKCKGGDPPPPAAPRR